MTHQSCPDPVSLSGFLDGGLSKAERGSVAAHLNQCEDCYEIATDIWRVLHEEGSVSEMPPNADPAGEPFDADEWGREAASHGALRTEPGEGGKIRSIPKPWRRVLWAGIPAAAVLALFLLWPAKLDPDLVGALDMKTSTHVDDLISKAIAGFASGGRIEADRFYWSTALSPAAFEPNEITRGPVATESPDQEKPPGFEEAGPELQRLAKRFPDSKAAIGQIVWHIGQHNFYQALTLCSQMEKYLINAKRSPDDPLFRELRYWQALAIYLRGPDEHEPDRREKAIQGGIERMQKLNAEFPDQTNILYTLAAMFRETGKAERATELWTRFLELEPAGPYAHAARAHLESLQEFGE